MHVSPAFIQFAACFAIATGVASLYLGAPNQRWLSRSLPARPSCVVGAALLVVGVVLWSQTVQLSTALFGALALSMILLVIFPCLGALRTIIGSAR